jgi:serine/threonine protein kinase
MIERRATIYSDHSYDEGTGDELEARRAGRLPVHEHPIGERITLPEPWASARQVWRETPTERSVRLATASVDELAQLLTQRRDPDVLAALAAKATAEVEAGREGEQKAFRKPSHEDFERVRDLGRGGFGTATLVKNLRLGRLEVHKTPHTAGGATTLLTEARLQAIQHPNIATIYEVDLQPPRIRMEYCNQGALWDAVDVKQSSPPYDDAEALMQICGKVASALHAIHSAGIVHSDVTPYNILLHDGEPKLTDFGISKGPRGLIPTEYVDHKQRTSLVRHPTFHAPEFDGSVKRPPWDIYTLAQTIITCFDDFPREELRSGYLIPSRVHLKAISALTNTNFGALLFNMLSPNPEERPTAGDVVQACATTIS